MEESESAPDTKINAFFTRRPHRKSRNGCKTCKKRHLKCDETKPRCLNCLNHSAKCVYASSPSSSQTADATTQGEARSKSSEKQEINVQFVESEYQHVFSASSINPDRVQGEKSPIAPPSSSPSTIHSQFCLEDFELKHFFLSSTCFTLAEDEASLDFWSCVVPRVGYKFPLVHHLMLALACLHMSRSEDHHHNCCTSRFDYHYSIGLRLMSTCLPEVIADNSKAIWIGSVLMCFISMARGPSEGNFLFFGSEGPVELISLLQGVDLISSLIQKRRPTDEQGLLETHLSPDPTRVQCLYRESICRLRNFAEERAASDPLLYIYQSAIDSVMQAFTSAFHDAIYDQSDTPSTKPEPFGFVLFTWATQMEKSFWDALQQKEVVPLVILAHFVVIIHQMNRTWLSQGWPEHILRGIQNFLKEEDHGLIQWPMDQVQISNI